MAHQSTLRFPSLLIKPDLQISRIRLPTGFIVRLTATADGARAEGIARPSLRKNTPGRKLSRAAPLHLVPLAEEVARAIIDMAINGLLRWRQSPVGEVRGPTPNRRFNRVRTSAKAPLVPGVNSSLACSLMRGMLFLDGLAPRYQRPSLGRWRGPSV